MFRPKMGFRNRLISLFPSANDRLEELKLGLEFRTFRRAGISLPFPPLIKRSILKAEAIRIGAQTLIETGTYLGDTVWFFRNDVPRIYSIEIAPSLADKARLRFKSYSGVSILTGDSSTLLAQIVPQIQGPTLVWLDGHYSGPGTGRGNKECPVWAELEALKTMTAPHSLLIDDARLFGSDKNYPPLEELLLELKRMYPAHAVSVECDVIQVRLPKVGH